MFHFNNPMDHFLQQLKNQHFTRSKQKEISLHKKAYNHFILDHFEKISSDLKRSTSLLKENKFILSKRRSLKFLEEGPSSDTNESVTSIRDLNVDNPFSELSPGYSTHESFTGAEDESKTHNIADIDVALQENRKIELQKAMVAESNKTMKNSEYESLTISQKLNKLLKTSTQMIPVKNIFFCSIIIYNIYTVRLVSLIAIRIIIVSKIKHVSVKILSTKFFLFRAPDLFRRNGSKTITNKRGKDTWFQQDPGPITVFYFFFSKS